MHTKHVTSRASEHRSLPRPDFPSVDVAPKGSDPRDERSIAEATVGHYLKAVPPLPPDVTLRSGRCCCLEQARPRQERAIDSPQHSSIRRSSTLRCPHKAASAASQLAHAAHTRRAVRRHRSAK
eukprot:21497-Chlamydomonas_euryale.AAC.3